MISDNTIISEVLPSYYWPRNVIVIVTECGHKHVRPMPNDPMSLVGTSFLCPFCQDATTKGDATGQAVDADAQ